MKQTMFALACAAVCVAGAETINSVNFEGYANVGPLLSNGYDDSGSAVAATPPETAFFVYEASSSSADGSTVAAHENESASTGWEDKLFGSKYLALSTEGGTLWRSIKHADVETVTETDGDGNSTSKISWTTGAQQTVPDTGLYIDTMVQFTPTEDGSEPELGEDAKLAIWLNVTQGENGVSTTNLCVRGSVLDADLASEKVTAEPQVFVLSGAQVEPGAWYRLTVKAVKNVLNANAKKEFVSAFQIFVDGKLLSVSAANVATEDFITFFSEDTTQDLPDCLGENAALLREGKLIPALKAYTTSDNSFLSAVGFKGSGAIDDFCVTDEEPSFTAATVTTVDFVLTWGDDVSSVTYTIEGGTSQSATSGEPISVDPNTKVTVAATAAPWYTIAYGIGEFTVTENTTNTITATLSSMNELNIGGFPANTSVSSTDVKGWADDKKISLSALQSSPYAYNSYLLNTDLLTTDPVLTIDDVTVANGKMTITVAAKTSSAENASAINLESIYGILYVKTGDTLDEMKSTEMPFVVKTGDNKDLDGKLTVTLDAGKFAQVKIGAKPQSAE